MDWYKVECCECGINVDLFQSEKGRVLCRDHYEDRINLKRSIKSHLDKKDSLNERLDFLTRYGLRFEEVFEICEEIRTDIVCEEERESELKKLRDNNKRKNKTAGDENTGVGAQ